MTRDPTSPAEGPKVSFGSLWGVGNVLSQARSSLVTVDATSRTKALRSRDQGVDRQQTMPSLENVHGSC